MISRTQLADIKALVTDSESSQFCLVESGEILLDLEPTPSPLDVYAVQKGVLTLLIGIAEDQYLIETLDHVNHHLAPEWTQLSPSDEAKLSIETLLSMTTGMDDDLAPLGDINKSWRYNNTAYQALKDILCQQADQSLQDLSEQWLFAPLGLSNTRWIERSEHSLQGKPVTALLSTAKDLVRIGELVLHKGKFRNQQLVPAYFIDKMTAPGSEENPAWGWGWWNNAASHYVQPMRERKTITGPLIPAAPADLIASRGAYGNYLYVVPGSELVIARTCAPREGRPRENFEERLFALLYPTQS